MSVRDVKEYYLSVVRDYKDMLQELQDFEIELQHNLVSPEKVDELKQLMEPIKNNYQTLSYIIYLLNKPQRNSKVKQAKYDKQHKKDISFIDPKFTKTGILEQNKQALQNIKSYTNDSLKN